MRYEKSRIASVVAVAAAVLSLCAPAAYAATDISLTARPADGVWGTNFQFRGFTSGGAEVKLQRRLYGASSFVDVGSHKAAGSDGYYYFYDQPISSADYRSIVVSDGSASTAVHVLVRVGVSIAVSRGGEKAVFDGKVLPGHRGTRVLLQEFDGVNKKWNGVLRTTLSSSSTYHMAFQATTNGRRLFRVAWPTQDGNHIWNVSAEIFVTWTR